MGLDVAAIAGTGEDSVLERRAASAETDTQFRDNGFARREPDHRVVQIYRVLKRKVTVVCVSFPLPRRGVLFARERHRSKNVSMTGVPEAVFDEPATAAALHRILEQS